MLRPFVVVTLSFSLAAFAPGTEAGWNILFNGHDLSGWVSRGGKARFEAQDGDRVRRAVLTTPNSFLCAEKTFGDFILECDFKVDPRLKSGLQICDDQTRAGAQLRLSDLRNRELTPAGPPPNTLSEAEKSDGWRLLWDGKTTDGWRGARSQTFPERGWTIANGVLTVHDSGGENSGRGVDIVTRERFSSFELLADFKVTPGANSGIKYFVQSSFDPGAPPDVHPTVGYEYQILDDARNPDAKLGRDGDRTLGSLYDLLPPATNKPAHAVGEWNTARIVVKESHIEHWLNGQLILACDRGSAAFRACIQQSKFKNIARFADWPDGHILLQDHGFPVHFRNLKVRVLPGS